MWINKWIKYMCISGISQLRICRYAPLSSDPVFMDDAQCAVTYEKSTFRCLFFELSGKIHRKLGYKNDNNSKNKNLKLDLSFDSADSAPFMWIWKLLNFFFSKILYLFRYWNIWEKKNWWEVSPPTKKHSGAGIFF